MHVVVSSQRCIEQCKLAHACDLLHVQMSLQSSIVAIHQVQDHTHAFAHAPVFLEGREHNSKVPWMTLCLCTQWMDNPKLHTHAICAACRCHDKLQLLQFTLSKIADVRSCMCLHSSRWARMQLQSFTFWHCVFMLSRCTTQSNVRAQSS